jgi:hypothetical protein
VTKRQSANWLQTFERWILPRTGAPLNYVTWTGIFAIASALKRNVYIPQELLGSWECFPNLYLFLVGPAGMRKTTTMDFLEELYEGVPEIAKTPQSGSQEAIMTMLVNQKDASLAILSGDFGFLYKGSQTNFIEFLVKAFDKNRVLDNITFARGHEKIVNPSVNLLTATTPAWIAENFTPAALGGGFASRVIWVNEIELRHFEIFFDHLDYKALNNLKQVLIHDLIHITQLHGQITIDMDVREYISSWNRHFMGTLAPKLDTRIQGYAKRKPRHVLALAIILHISKSDELRVTMEDFNESLTLLGRLEEKLLPVFTSVGKNPYSLDMEDIVDFIKQHGRVERRRLLARFRHIATPEVLVNLASSLCAVFDRLKYVQEGDYYELSDSEKNKLEGVEK